MKVSCLLKYKKLTISNSHSHNTFWEKYWKNWKFLRQCFLLLSPASNVSILQIRFSIFYKFTGQTDHYKVNFESLLLYSVEPVVFNAYQNFWKKSSIMSTFDNEHFSTFFEFKFDKMRQKLIQLFLWCWNGYINL